MEEKNSNEENDPKLKTGQKLQNYYSNTVQKKDENDSIAVRSFALSNTADFETGVYSMPTTKKLQNYILHIIQVKPLK